MRKLTREAIIQVYVITHQCTIEYAESRFEEEALTIQNDYPDTLKDKVLDHILWNMCNLTPVDVDEIIAKGIPEEEPKPAVMPEYIQLFFAETDRVWNEMIKEDNITRRLELCDRYSYLEERCQAIKDSKTADIKDWDTWCGHQLSYLDGFGKPVTK